MLQPRTYPELIGKSLVLEAEPFITMVEDDDPWVEGLFLTLCIGLLVGMAQLIGGLLMTAAMPPVGAVFEALWRAWQQLGLDTGLGANVDPDIVKTNLRQTWDLLLFMRGYGGGWARLYILALAPLILLLQWLFSGLTAYFVGKWLGGTGTLNQMLGATALIAAPSILLLLSVVPFVSVSSLLLLVWPLLIIYRAIEVAHDLPWQRSAIVACAPLIALAILLLLLSVIGGAFASGGGLG